MSRAAKVTLWAAIFSVAAFELWSASLILRPDVDATYRAYFIDRSSDCWPHVTPARYQLGTPLTFVDGPGTRFDANKICGWFYPNAQGTWSYGRYSLLRFNFAPVAGPLRLEITAGAMVDALHPVQNVVVSANGTALGTLRFNSATPSARTIEVPAALAASGSITLRFAYPDARPGTELGVNEDAHLRAIRMVSLTLAPAARGPA